MRLVSGREWVAPEHGRKGSAMRVRSLVQGTGAANHGMGTCIPDTAGQCQGLLPAGFEDELPRVHRTRP
jgi:hypothetical protein